MDGPPNKFATCEMNDRKYLDYLSSLRGGLGDLCVVKCRMAHERVLIAPDSMLPVVCRFPEGSYKRVGLCSVETRAQRLGCSHTMARIKLRAAIDHLEPADDADRTGTSVLRDELNFLDNEIHLLDHRKGDAEKALARVLEEPPLGSHGGHRAPARRKLRMAEQDIQDLERLHDQYVNRIGVLRDKVVAQMDRLIEDVTGNCRSLADDREDIDVMP